MSEFIDPIFVKRSPKRSFSVIQNERFRLVFVKTGSIISGTGRGNNCSGNRRKGKRAVAELTQEGEGMIIDGNRKEKRDAVLMEQKGERHGSETKQEEEKSRRGKKKQEGERTVVQWE